MLNKSTFSRVVGVASLGLLGAAIVGPAACSSTAEPITAPPTSGSGGSTGGNGGSTGGTRSTGGSGGSTSGSGGSNSGSGGSTGGSTGGTGGSTTGGTGGTTTGGTGGTTTGGTGGAGGTMVSGTGGAGGTSTMGPGGTFLCAGLKPIGSTITSFTVSAPIPGGQFSFNSEGGTNGGTFTYPAGITVTFGGGSLTAKGMVTTYSGVGIYFDQCIDASAYAGVTFKLTSTGLPAMGMITFSAQTNSTLPVDTMGKKGACVPANPADPYPSCHEPTTIVPANGTVMVPWSMLLAGMPAGAVTGSEIVGLKWQFPYTAATATLPATPAYTANVAISDLKFYGGSGPVGSTTMPPPAASDAGMGGGG